MGNNMNCDKCSGNTRNQMDMRNPRAGMMGRYPQGHMMGRVQTGCDECSNPRVLEGCVECGNTRTSGRCDDYGASRDILKGKHLAMGYVPWQQFECTYEPSQALRVGTIFPELDKPFLAYGRKGMR